MMVQQLYCIRTELPHLYNSRMEQLGVEVDNRVNYTAERVFLTIYLICDLTPREEMS